LPTANWEQVLLIIKAPDYHYSYSNRSFFLDVEDGILFINKAFRHKSFKSLIFAGQQFVLSLHGNMQRKVRATQGTILPNRKVPGRREQQVPQKITACCSANCGVRVKM